MSDYWLEKGDYLNFEHLTIGYNVPLKSRAIRSLRVSCNVSNLGTITSYKGAYADDQQLCCEQHDGY